MALKQFLNSYVLLFQIRKTGIITENFALEFVFNDF